MKSKSLENLLYSAIGLVAMALIIIAVNFIAGALRMRADLTQEKLYTLSDGTKEIIAKLDGKLKIRFYCTRNDTAMPVNYRNYAQRVDDLLAEYKKIGGGKIQVEKLDPQPDTDAEDFANMDGVEPRQVSFTDSVYMGLSFSMLDQKATLPFLAPDREKLLEYDISRAIAQVQQPPNSAERPVLGIMSSLPVFGATPNPMMMMNQQRPQEPWLFVTELQQTFKVKQIPLDTEKIDEDVKLLIVLHPKNITDKGQFAIDQFVLGGGRVLAFVDPFTFVEGRQNPMMGGGPQTGSTLDKLFKAWGIEFDAGKVLADEILVNKGVPDQFRLFVPTFSPEYMKKDEIFFGQLDNVMLGWAGAFSGTPVDGLKKDVLLHSSTNSQLMDRFMIEMAPAQAAKDFKPSGKELEVAIRLTGKFKTAFTNGLPEEKSEEPDKTNAAPATVKKDFLQTSTKDGMVILVADADFLHEQLYADVRNFGPQRVVVGFLSGNLTFLQNAVELLTGDSRLINARSRASVARHFTLIREMQARAAKDQKKELETLSAEFQKINENLRTLQSKKDPSQRNVMSPEQQQEYEKALKARAETNRRLKEVNKSLRREEESLETLLKLFNIAAMPLLVAFLGIGLALYNRKRTAAK